MITDAYSGFSAGALVIGILLVLLALGVRAFSSYGQHFPPTRADRDPLYSAYMRSPEWRIKRIQCLRAANNTCANPRCRRRYPDYYLRAHHLTYDRLYNELPEDLQCLCVPCHQLEHLYRKVS